MQSLSISLQTKKVQIRFCLDNCICGTFICSKIMNIN
uniref:Uncharacterized protein n=1 Tax=Anguilla anguilla TaxID=7936 RepID=A0A0E9VRL4_ANGAN